MQTGANALAAVYHPVDMRTAPTLGRAGVASDYYVAVSGTTVNCTALPAITGMSSPRGSSLTFIAGASIGYASWPAAGTATAKLSFSSEL